MNNMLDVDIARSALNALDSSDIKVSVTNGWVTLGGSVASHDEKRAAEGAVIVLPGVRGVTNNVTVRPRGAPAHRDGE